MNELTADATALVRRLQARELSATELAESLLTTLAADELAAWECVDADQLLAQAAALDGLDDAARWRLPLFGVPVAIKDAFDTTDLPTGYGSRLFAGHRPGRDAETVVRLRHAGALIVGKTKCTEFSWMSATDTRNPLAPGRTPGGSSSGSAAAVAAGQVPLATGTQTAGSTIRPGSYCGVLGYKPTFATFPRAGVFPLAASLDTVGVFARSVVDLRLVSGVLAAADPLEPTIRRALPLVGAGDTGRPPRVGFIRTPWWADVEPESQRAIETTIDLLRAAGVEVEELLGLGELQQLAEAHRVIQWVESAASLAEEVRASPELVSDALREALAEGTAIPFEHYRVARASAGALTATVDDALARFDGVLTPSAHGVPPEGLEFTGDPLFCRAWTLIGAPCISLPVAWTAQHLPVGVQLVGARHRDHRLLDAAAKLLELATG